MARQAPDGLSRHPTKGFRITSGKTLDGRPRLFWLGHDRVKAEYHAHCIRGCMAHMRSGGRDVWTDADLADVKVHLDGFKKALSGLQNLHARDAADLQERYKSLDAEREELQFRQVVFSATFGGGDAPQPTASLNPASDPEKDHRVTPNLHAAVDLFADAFDKRSVASNHKKRMRQLLGDLKHYRQDLALAEVDRVWLQSLTDEMKSRPKSRKRKTPLAPYTVRNMLRAWSQFFDWLDANGDSPKFGGWQAPRRWQDLFEVKLTKLMTKAERDAHADGPKQLTLDQVVKLYQAIRNDRHRIWVSLGVFAALGQEEISSLRRDEFELSAGMLTHRRSKTGQLGRYWLSPEVVTLIKDYFASTPTDADGTAFFTADGSKLVSGTSDAVRQAWTDIVERVDGIDKDQQGFYHLRKFTADYAMRKGGQEVRDAVLAHTPTSVGGKHYSNARNYESVFQVQRDLYEDLKAGGYFNVVVRRGKPRTKAAA